MLDHMPMQFAATYRLRRIWREELTHDLNPAEKWR
jgi:hypothetical protein